jgi:hypothetical protein
MFWRRHQTFPNYLGRKIRFSFNGYGNRIVTDDGPFLTRSHDDGSPEAWEKHQTMSEDKKSLLQNTTLALWNLGWSSFYSFTDGNVIELLDRNGLRLKRHENAIKTRQLSCQ